MNYRDIEMLNQSMSGLGDTLLRNRMMAEQKADRAQAAAERAQDRGDRLAAQKFNQEAEKERLNQQVLDRLANNRIREAQEMRGESQDTATAKYREAQETRGAAQDTATAKYREDTLKAQRKALKAQRGEQSKKSENKKADDLAKSAKESLEQSKENLLSYMDYMAEQVKSGASDNEYANNHVLNWFSSLPEVEQKAMMTQPLYHMIKDKTYNWKAHPTRGGSKGKPSSTKTITGPLFDALGNPRVDPTTGDPITYTRTEETNYGEKTDSSSAPSPAAKPPSSDDISRRFSVKPLENSNLDVTKKFPGSP